MILHTTVSLTVKRKSKKSRKLGNHYQYKVVTHDLKTALMICLWLLRKHYQRMMFGVTLVYLWLKASSSLTPPIHRPFPLLLLLLLIHHLL